MLASKAPIKSRQNEQKSKQPARTPAYLRIEDDIRAKVRDGSLSSGAMLSSRHNLAREYGVALSTAQQAVANLIADGILETFDRRGTFVVSKPQAPVNADPADESLSHSPSGGTQPAGTEALRHGGMRYGDPEGGTHRTTATVGIAATSRIDTTASPDVGSLWARFAIRSLEHVVSAAGGTTRYFERYSEEKREDVVRDDASAVPLTEAIQTLRREGADAIAVVGLCDAKDMSDAVVRAVDVEHVPTVYISWHEVQPPLAQVFYDNRYAGYQAAQHLLRRGYRCLAFLKPFGDAWLMERIEGARSAVRHAGFQESMLRVYPADSPRPLDQPGVATEAALTAARELIATLAGQGPDQPCGVIAPNDDIAYTVLAAASELGLSPGKDFGLAGFDDDPRSFATSLTTVRPPVEAMGEEAGRLLLRALHGDKRGHQVRLRSQLIPRMSTLLSSR